jgi:hypothetical protein
MMGHKRCVKCVKLRAELDAWGAWEEGVPED